MPDVTLTGCFNEASGVLEFRNPQDGNSPTFLGCIDLTTEGHIGDPKIVLGPCAKCTFYTGGQALQQVNLEQSYQTDYTTVWHMAQAYWLDIPNCVYPVKGGVTVGESADGEKYKATCESGIGIYTNVTNCLNTWTNMVINPEPTGEANRYNKEFVIICSVSMKRTAGGPELLTNGDFPDGLNGWYVGDGWEVIGDGSSYWGCINWGSKVAYIDIPEAEYNKWALPS